MPIETLNKIFLDHCKINPTSFGDLVINEAQNIKGLKKVTIKGVSMTKTIAVKLDYYVNISRYFTTRLKNINKGCDLLLITKKNNQFYTFLCELKSTKFSRKSDVEPKFINSKLFLEYTLALAKENFEKTLVLDNFAYILFHLRGGKASIRTTTPFLIENNSQKYNSIKVIEISKYNRNNFQIQLDKLIELM